MVLIDLGGGAIGLSMNPTWESNGFCVGGCKPTGVYVPTWESDWYIGTAWPPLVPFWESNGTFFFDDWFLLTIGLDDCFLDLLTLGELRLIGCFIEWLTLLDVGLFNCFLELETLLGVGLLLLEVRLFCLWLVDWLLE